MTPLPTNSRLETAFACRASTVLPQADVRSADAAYGQAWHRFMQKVVEYQALADGDLEQARHAAANEAPETLREAMRSIPLERLRDLDLDPAKCAVEVAFAYDVATGKARELGRGAERNYGTLTPTEYAGTIDFAQLTGPRRGKVRDWKTLYSRRAPAKDNIQLKKCALDLARANDLEEVEVELTRLDEDGAPWHDSAVLSLVDLDAFAFDLEDLHHQIEADRSAYAAGLLPKATISDGCRYCPSARYCPAQANLARALVDPALDVSLVGGRDLVLTDDLVRDLVVRLPIAEKRLEEIKRAVKLYASQTPVAMPDGRYYGPRPDVKREVVDVQLAQSLLAKRLGPEAAKAALSPAEITMKGLEEARKAYFSAHPEAKKVKGAVKEMDEAIEKDLHDAGALRMKDAPVVTLYTPKVKE